MARDSIETDNPIPDENLAQTCDNNTHIASLYGKRTGEDVHAHDLTCFSQIIQLKTTSGPLSPATQQR